MGGYIGSKASVTQVDGYNRTEADAEFVSDPNDVITVSGSNVGIGTDSPSGSLQISATFPTLVLDETNTDAAYQQTQFGIDNGSFRIQTRTSTNAFVSNDYLIDKDANGATDHIWRIGNSERMRIDSSGRVGIGTSSPADLLDLSSSDPNIRLTKTGVGYSLVRTGGSDASLFLEADAGNTASGSDIIMRVDSDEKMRISATGVVMAGKTASAIANVGVELRGSSGVLTATTQDVDTVYFTRKGTAGGPIINFYRDTTHAGVIGVGSDADLYIGEDVVGLQFQNTGADRIDPFNPDSNVVRDNAIDLGGSASRFDDIYATNGSIQTSDRNEKQDIEVLSDAETRVAQACKGLLRKFRWQDAVAEKGDDARIHFGIIAQDLQDAFTAEGLDAGRYAMFISSTWWETQTEVPAVEAVAEVLDDDGNVATEAVQAKEAYTRTDTYETQEEAPEGATERTRLGVRYPELLAFIIGAM